MDLASLPLFLTLVTGFCWSLVYIEAIRVGFRDRTYAIPFWALALNFAWELLNTVLLYQLHGLVVQTWINGIWLILDTAILYTYFRWGRRHFSPNVDARWFIPWSLSALAAAFLLQYMFIDEFGLLRGRAYIAFPQNLLMSVLFIVMLAQRGSSEGQSMLIAVSKWIGTLAPTILVGIIGTESFAGPNRLILVTGALCAVFDLIYIAMLARTRQRERRGETGGVVF